MSLISETIANLVNGVSQQPNALRLASQCELQENCSSSVVDGLCPRNGTVHSARISNTPSPSAFSHLINRDSSERYRVIITGGELKVYDLGGIPQTVTYGAGSQAYISTSQPADDLVALTVADYTFILNKKKVVQHSTETIPTRPIEALVWVRQASVDSTYTITIDGHTATRTTGDAQNLPETVATDNIAANLYTSFVPMLGASGVSYSYTNAGSLLYFSRTNGALDFSISVTDSVGDQATVLIKGITQRFTNLPARGYPGFKTEVQGEGSSFNTSYWVEFISEGSNPYGGVWKESTKPGEFCALDASTMPQVLVRNADGTFTLKAADWDKRTVGDVTKTNPFPSFVGRTINDVFFHNNRLGFLSDESMILSRSGLFFNFFRESVIQLLDTDPIDIAASHTKVSILNHAVPFNESLLMFSDQTQFILGHNNTILTPRTASLDQTTEYSCSTKVKPIGAGNNVYFVQERGPTAPCVSSRSTLHADQGRTGHHLACPEVHPEGVFKLTSSNTESIMVALSHDAPNKLFVYQYYIVDDTKLQSAWHTWTFGANDTVLNADFIGSDLHLVISRPDGVYLEVLTVTTSLTRQLISRSRSTSTA
jgi:hypothetical protein